MNVARKCFLLGVGVQICALYILMSRSMPVAPESTMIANVNNVASLKEPRLLPDESARLDSSSVTSKPVSEQFGLKTFSPSMVTTTAVPATKSSLTELIKLDENSFTRTSSPTKPMTPSPNPENISAPLTNKPIISATPSPTKPMTPSPNLPIISATPSPTKPPDDWKKRTCYISQMGSDGFGHQTEGKLTMIILAEMLKPSFKYIHIPYEQFEHTNVSGADADEFIGLQKLYANESAVGVIKREHIRSVPHFIENVKSGNFICDPQTVYWNDWAFYYIYNEQFNREVDNIIQRSATFHKIREAYFASPKQLQGFVHDRPNVVLHIRRGDAVRRSYPGSYFVKGMEYYETYFAELGRPRPYFIVDTDDPKWKFLNTLKPRFNVTVSENIPDFRPAFHRMVMADGFIISSSSLSRSAAMFRDFRYPIVARYARKYLDVLNPYVYMS